MDPRTKSSVALVGLMACVLSPQPAAAQGGNPTGLGASMPSSFGRALSDFEMGNLRGAYLPAGGAAIMNIGNAYSSDVWPFTVPGTGVNQAPPSQTIVLSPAQAASHIRETWAAIAGHLARRLSEVSDTGGVWIVTLFRDPDG